MVNRHPVEVNLAAEDHIECPYTLYRRLHASDQPAIDPNLGVLVTGYQDLVALSKNTSLYSSSISADGQGPRHMGVGSDPVQDDVEAILADAHPMVNALFTADPPIHTRHRKLLSKALSPSRVRAMESSIHQITHDLIDGFVAKGRVDLLKEFAVPLPVTVIADILGVDRSDMWTFKHWGDLMIAGNIDVLSHTKRRDVAHAIVDMHRYMVPRIEQRRRHPSNDLLSEMVNATVDGEAPLSTAELLPIIDQVLLAGHETTTNLIANGVLILLRDAPLMDRVRADLSLVAPMVEEMLRFDPPIHCTYRRATGPALLNGVPVDAGSMVLPVWAAAGWDPTEFPQPHKFDLTRPNVNRHMGFGHGPHFCAGAELARLEARIAFEAILTRLDSLELVESESDLTHLPSFASHGYKRVVLQFR